LPSPQALTEKAWQALLKYVDGGGNLLITGPLDRDEHWQIVARQQAIIPDARTEPLTFHEATLAVGKKILPLNFAQDKQNWLDSLQFHDVNSVRVIPRGAGRIFWCAYPLELADDLSVATELYSQAASLAGVTPSFKLLDPLPGALLVYATVLDDAVLYVLVSEETSAYGVSVNLLDSVSGGHVNVMLDGEHAALVLLDKKSGAVIAEYESGAK